MTNMHHGRVICPYHCFLRGVVVCLMLGTFGLPRRGKRQLSKTLYFLRAGGREGHPTPLVLGVATPTVILFF